jgi:hypothetical protein
MVPGRAPGWPRWSALAACSIRFLLTRSSNRYPVADERLASCRTRMVARPASTVEAFPPTALCSLVVASQAAVAEAQRFALTSLGRQGSQKARCGVSKWGQMRGRTVRRLRNQHKTSILGRPDGSQVRRTLAPRNAMVSPMSVSARGAAARASSNTGLDRALRSKPPSRPRRLAAPQSKPTRDAPEVIPGIPQAAAGFRQPKP